MNAKEFAHELEKAASFIRQQQAEIERLTMLCDCMTTESNRKGNEIEALKQIIDANNLNQNIGQFVKPTNKPVAWMDYLEHSDVYDLNVSGRGIPLYTHPVKELTDEEILSLTGFKDNPYDIFIEYEKEDLIEFARAILRKAQK